MFSSSSLPHEGAGGGGGGISGFEIFTGL